MKRTALFLAGLLGCGAALADLPPGALVRVFTNDASLAVFQSVHPELTFENAAALTDATAHAYTLVLPDKGVPFSLHAPACSAQGKLSAGPALLSGKRDGKTVLVIRKPLSEGCPGAMVCIDGGKTCWTPEISGDTGSLVTTSRFRDWISIDSVYGFPAHITDPDPKGTNVRETPGGRIADVIPHPGKTGSEEARLRRLIIVTAQSGDWFAGSYDRTRFGWVHRKMTGTYAGATEDGPARLVSAPDGDGPGTRLPDCTPLRLLEVKGEWAKVSAQLKDGSRKTGWIHSNATIPNPLHDCVK